MPFSNIVFIILCFICYVVNSQASITTSPLDIKNDELNGLFVIGQSTCSGGALGISIYHYTADSSLLEPNVNICPSSSRQEYTYVSSDYNPVVGKLYISYFTSNGPGSRRFFVRVIDANRPTALTDPLLTLDEDEAFPGVIKSYVVPSSREALVYVLTSSQLVQVNDTPLNQTEPDRNYRFNSGNIAVAMVIVRNNVVVVGVHSPAEPEDDDRSSTSGSFGNYVATVPLPGTSFRWNGEILNPSRDFAMVSRNRLLQSSATNTSLSLATSPIISCGDFTYIILQTNTEPVELEVHLYTSEPFAKITTSSSLIPPGDELLTKTCVYGPSWNGIAFLFSRQTSGTATQYTLFMDTELNASPPVTETSVGLSQSGFQTIFIGSNGQVLSRLLFSYIDGQSTLNGPAMGLIETAPEGLNSFMNRFYSTPERSSCPQSEYFDKYVGQCRPCDENSSTLPECSNAGANSSSLSLALGVTIPLIIIGLLGLCGAFWFRKRRSSTKVSDRKSKASGEDEMSESASLNQFQNSVSREPAPYLLLKPANKPDISNPVLVDSSVLERSPSHPHTLTPIDHTLPVKPTGLTLIQDYNQSDAASSKYQSKSSIQYDAESYRSQTNSLYRPPSTNKWTSMANEPATLNSNPQYEKTNKSSSAAAVENREIGSADLEKLITKLNHERTGASGSLHKKSSTSLNRSYGSFQNDEFSRNASQIRKVALEEFESIRSSSGSSNSGGGGNGSGGNTINRTNSLNNHGTSSQHNTKTKPPLPNFKPQPPPPAHLSSTLSRNTPTATSNINNNSIGLHRRASSSSSIGSRKYSWATSASTTAGIPPPVPKDKTPPRKSQYKSGIAPSNMSVSPKLSMFNIGGGVGTSIRDSVNSTATGSILNGKTGPVSSFYHVGSSNNGGTVNIINSGDNATPKQGQVTNRGSDGTSSTKSSDGILSFYQK